MKKNPLKIIPILMTSFFSVPAVSFAEEVFLLEKSLPNISQGSGVGPYLSSIFNLGVGIATALAVLMIVIGGIKYMMTGSVIGKGDAKDTISAALLGLLLALASVIILQTINPDLLNLGLSKPAIEVSGGETSVGAPTSNIQLMCTSCSTVPSSLPMKPGICLGQPCQLDSNLITKLEVLDSTMDGWRITEAYPPEVTHQNRCHYNGSCIDATLSSNSEFWRDQFVRAASDSGLTACYETTPSPHFSVYDGSKSC